ncbi:MAG: prephenate dehydratase [Planctomycetes bacterium]|nr:prephenate dehydratase [Planctomycetota bacterium]
MRLRQLDLNGSRKGSVGRHSPKRDRAFGRSRITSRDHHRFDPEQIENPPRIAFLGPLGSYSHLAATGKFGASVEYEPVSDIRAAFSEVERGHADFALVPVENSIGGGVIETLDAFINSPVKICAEIRRRIHHNVLARCPLERIKRLYSKPEVFSQCQRWLTETGMATRTVPVASSSKAAEMAAAEEHGAAIGSTLASELYDLPVLLANIEDDPSNTTRFFVLGMASARRSGDDMTAVMFATSHRSGALVDVLDVFRTERVNLTMITSRPSRTQNWEYLFFIDAEGHVDDAAMCRAIDGARDLCLHFSVLGSFPRARDVD